MDSERAAAVVQTLAEHIPDGVLLWRGEGLSGSDIDLVVLGEHTAPVSHVLRNCGLTPAPQEPGRVLWRLLPGEHVVVDVVAAHTWPSMYPALTDVADRAQRGALGLLVASPGDRLLMHTAEAIAGWPLSKSVAKMSAAASEPDVTDNVTTASLRDRGLRVLASIAERPELLVGRADRDRLPMLTAARLGSRSAQARSALASRLPGLPMTRRTPAGAPPERPLLIALSGMDGAGKSTAALALLDRYDERGEAALVHWTRLAGNLRLLGRVARRARRILRRTAPLAASGAPAPAGDAGQPDTQARGRRSGFIERTWVIAVAASSVRAARRAHRIRRGGTHVICDRWLLDALVDLRIRYGPHPLAEWVLRRGFPKPDVSVLLRIECEQAAARKPGDQTEAVLKSMSVYYDQLAKRVRVSVLDAGRASDQVVEELGRLLDPLGPGRH